MSPRSQLTRVRPKCGWCGALAGMALRARLRLAASSCSGESAAAGLRRAARTRGLAPLADAADQLGAGEMAIAVVDRGRGRAVGEIQIDGVRADRAAALVPIERRGAHALHQSAADQPQDVDLMRALAIGDAAALPDVELGCAARARHPVGEVPGVDHADAAERAGRHDLAHARDRQIVAVRMPDLEDDAGALGRLDHRLRLLDADRHRLLGQDVLFRSAGLRDMTGVQLGRGRDIDGVERARSAASTAGRGAPQHRFPRPRSRASPARVPRWRPARMRDCRESREQTPSRPPPFQRFRYGFCRTYLLLRPFVWSRLPRESKLRESR